MEILGLDTKGIGISIFAAVATGTAFTQDIPATPNDWWKFATGLLVATALQYLAWQRQQAERKQVWTPEQRAEVQEAIKGD